MDAANTACLLYNNECTDREGVGMRAQCYAGGVDETDPLELCVQQLYLQRDHNVPAYHKWLVEGKSIIIKRNVHIIPASSR
jgi:hypothetical protein